MTEKPSWKIRRAIIITSLLFVMLMVGKVILFGPFNSTTEAIASSLIMAAIGIIGSYVFGAVWDDKGR